MKASKKILVMASVVGVLFGIHAQAWAAGGLPPLCLITNPIGPTMNGTVSVAVLNYAPPLGDVEATLRLRWRGQEKFFRARIAGAQILTPEDLACRILEANPTDSDGFTILQAFNIAPTKSLKITTRSLSGGNFDFIPGSPTNDHSVLADITIYVEN